MKKDLINLTCWLVWVLRNNVLKHFLEFIMLEEDLFHHNLLKSLESKLLIILDVIKLLELINDKLDLRFNLLLFILIYSKTLALHIFINYFLSSTKYFCYLNSHFLNFLCLEMQQKLILLYWKRRKINTFSTFN